MGQRHQVYVRLPAINYGAGNPNNKAERTIGLHHQWLYGRLPLMQLAHFLTFVKNAGADTFRSDYYSGQDILNACYSLNVEEGYFAHVHTLDAECDNPLLGDNNDGITIVSLLGAKPTYCFMNVDHTEGQYDLPKMVPLTAHEYLSSYYPAYSTDAKWDAKHGEGFSNSCRLLVDRLDEYAIISLNEVKRIFPLMFENQKELA